MGMGLLGLWVWNYGNGSAEVVSMELWEWACWGCEYEIMEWNYHKWLVTCQYKALLLRMVPGR